MDKGGKPHAKEAEMLDRGMEHINPDVYPIFIGYTSQVEKSSSQREGTIFRDSSTIA